MKPERLALALLCVACGSCVDERTEFAAEALADNLRTTDYTALVRITAVNVRETDDNEYEVVHAAEVVETYRGTPRERIEFIEYVESRSDLDSEVSEKLLIVSLCGANAQPLYLPGVGFEIPGSDELQKHARKLAASASDTSVTACD